MRDGATNGAVRVGIGLAAVGRPAYINAGRARDFNGERDVHALRHRTWLVLDAAYEAGVRYVDVARSYGGAEEFLAAWLSDRGTRRPPEAEDVEIGSKWGYRYVGDWRMDATVHEVKDHSLAAFTEQVTQSKGLLGQRLSVYHVHSATLDTGVMHDRLVHRALAGLRADGVRVGISTSGPRQCDTIRRALEIVVDGELLFTSVQSTWNLLEPSAGDALAEAADAGCRVIVKEAVANGRLTSSDPHPHPDLQAVADRLGVPLDRLATAAALAQPWAWRVLSGAANPEQVRSNVAAAALTLDAVTLDEALSYADKPEEYWTARSHRAWA
jgi:aryl-alcohol dehydrogenase-like predicted oxidoreductase